MRVPATVFRKNRAAETNEGLISKLIAQGAVELTHDELRFTAIFCKHMAHYRPEDCFEEGQTEGWRRIFREFRPALDSLSDEEISRTIVLLDYFVNVVESNRGL